MYIYMFGVVFFDKGYAELHNDNQDVSSSWIYSVI